MYVEIKLQIVKKTEDLKGNTAKIVTLFTIVISYVCLIYYKYLIFFRILIFFIIQFFLSERQFSILMTEFS